MGAGAADGANGKAKCGVDNVTSSSFSGETDGRAGATAGGSGVDSESFSGQAAAGGANATGASGTSPGPASAAPAQRLEATSKVAASRCPACLRFRWNRVTLHLPRAAKATGANRSPRTAGVRPRECRDARSMLGAIFPSSAVLAPGAPCHAKNPVGVPCSSGRVAQAGTRACVAAATLYPKLRATVGNRATISAAALRRSCRSSQTPVSC